MNLQQRIDIMVELGKYIRQNGELWQHTIEKAYQHNPWFIPDFVQVAANNVSQEFLERSKLENWASHYHLDSPVSPKQVGIVMAGNIPMVGFHDLLSVFICGHRQLIKLSSKDDILVEHLIRELYRLDDKTRDYIETGSMLKGCDAYIATGTNNSSRYFEQYFGSYPHIIRGNKTSIAYLSGDETMAELEKLSDDIHLFFGLGCRNVTKLIVPENYDFIPLLKSFNKYQYFRDHHKYNNNYDYQLSIMLMNNIYYMTNGSTLLVENAAAFSPISVVHYEYAGKSKENTKDIQCVAGSKELPFGKAQSPTLFSYADGVDTMEFLLTL